ncbi:uncharacterized protein NPIL_696451 [Nephila pilipes]|uniref:Gustatory receptor n=1 Tax=Nephila pilipes TaxID=299642 RepID=A0A8X6QY73_NEPPI|nr:uncharacterized protein NPIL_696451 [Nephila pilipes]
MFHSINKKAKNLQKHIEVVVGEDTAFNSSSDSLMRKRNKYCKEKKQGIYEDEFPDTTASIFPSNLKFCSSETQNIIAEHSSDFECDISGERNTNQIFLESNEILTSLYENERKFFRSVPESEIFNQSSLEKRNSEKRGNSISKCKTDHSMARKIQNLNGRFINSSILVQETDDIFSLQVLTVLTITFVRTCSYIYIYISTDWKNYDPYAGISIALQIFYDFLAFGSVATEASLVAEEAKKFALLIMRVRQVDKTKEMRSLLQSEIAALTAYATNVQLTAWKFFTVSRNFIPTVIGVTVTYVIVILQLYQVIQDSKCMKKIADQ